MEKIIIKVFIISTIFLSFLGNLNAQSINNDKVSLTNFIKRMYTASPFEGVKVIDDYENQYLVSVISLEKAKYSNESIMYRVAQVKAQSQASTFLNGANISVDLTIITTEEKQTDSLSRKSTVSTIESIRENSIGFVKSMELLNSFEIQETKRMVFIYSKKLEKN
jgi:hypothetical protein